MYIFPGMEKTQNCQIYSQFFTVLQRKTVVRSNVLQIFQNAIQNTVILMYIYQRMEQKLKFALKSTYWYLVCTTYIESLANTTHTMSKGTLYLFF